MYTVNNTVYNVHVGLVGSIQYTLYITRVGIHWLGDPLPGAITRYRALGRRY